MSYGGCALPSLASLSPLRADLFFTPPIAANATLPDGSIGLWQPTVVTLVSGQSEAVLIDTLFTSDQDFALSDWIEETLNGKRLRTIYHGGRNGLNRLCNHFFNGPYMQRRFPGVEIVSTNHSIDHMATQLTPKMQTFWNELFPGQIPEESFQVLAKPLADNKFTLEGHIFEAIDVGHSDTDETTFLHVPSLDMVVAGDIVYNDVHMWMTESTTQGQRDAWIRSLDKVAAVNPGIVVSSHHRQGGVDGAFNIDAMTTEKNATDLYNKVLEVYPNRIGNLVLWLGCQAQFD
ncbi:beta-lactamase-like protein [Mycena rosella]|uniref:Beta-lactamase-like protein n=1 Tax=Mycena rosella TaxID=1033263 RepID=A0AAD7DQ78_MYCRO|nr:beta-lactamase-like protein [Mycena rosella]